jgi:hypothetical protein
MADKHIILWTTTANMSSLLILSIVSQYFTLLCVPTVPVNVIATQAAGHFEARRQHLQIIAITVFIFYIQ